MILDIKIKGVIVRRDWDGLEVDGGGLSGGGSFVIKIEGKRKVCCGEVERWSGGGG